MAFRGNINTKLFVGGLNYSTSDQQLAQFFGKFGNVVECVVMKFPDSGESRGFGFVTFSTEQEVQWCLSSLPLSLDGKNVDVKRAEAPTRDGTKVGGGLRDGIKRKGGDANCKVFVGGLNYNTQDDMLKQVFSRYGKVNDWVIMKFPDSGESRGFGFVTFSSPEEVERCLINQPIIVDGKSVDIKKAEPPSARAPANTKQTKMMSRFKYQKEKESAIENKLPRGGGTMADICNGGNQCGGGFGNNCGHDTFSTIASQVVAMTTNQHKQEPVREEVQDYSAYYQEYSKWYASWRQYNEYLQRLQQGVSSSSNPPPLPPGERPKTPPQQESLNTPTQPPSPNTSAQPPSPNTPAQPPNKASIRAEPQYNQQYFTGSRSSQQEGSSEQGESSQPDRSSQQYWPNQQAPTADQYNQQFSPQYQAGRSNAGPQYNEGNQQFSQSGQYNQQRKRSNSPPPWVPQFNERSGPQFNNDGPVYNNYAPQHGSSSMAEPERNEFYQHNLETQQRKKMRMSS